MRATWRVQQFRQLRDIPAPAWNTLAGPDNPLVSHAFLSGLEEHGCLRDHGWTPCHVAVFDGATLIGALPLYLRSNSHGEFVFDWSWAEAYERAGGRYYPKLVSAVPFTPVTGPRLLVCPGQVDADRVRAVLLETALAVARENGLSSWHCLFPEPSAAEWLEGRGLLPRLTCQFHWRNAGYRDFQDFLDTLSSKRRKQIRRERRAVVDAGVDIVRLGGRDITAELWRVFNGFYRSTFDRRWGSPRLTLAFFCALSESLPDQTLLLLARQRGRWIAGAFAMAGTRTLFGRHWGCAREVPFLHFELCYYQTIEHCIQSKLCSVDAGVQGEHKLARGFEPVAAVSCHWLRERPFHNAIQRYLEQERAQVRQHVNDLRLHLPYRSVGDDAGTRRVATP